MKKQKKRLFIISLIAIVGFIYWNSQANIEQYLFSKHVIFWEKNRTLKPSDFQGDSNNNSKSKIWWHHALYLKSASLKDAEVKAVFDKDKSWIKDTLNFKANMKLQKLSFDMYEAYARKFNKEINKIKEDDESTFSDLEKIGDNINIELRSMQNALYNTDLAPPKLVEFWRPKIDELLKMK
jgi:hypothetical protein